MRRFPDFSHKEFDILKKLNSPVKIQDFIDSLPINFERKGETCRSPLQALIHNEAHCIEGAMLAAAAFWYHGEKPLLMDLKTAAKDLDHVVALFRYKNRWGAISKTNHAVLRYRDPVYKNIRELAMSYFNEYFFDDGKKTMRSFSRPFNLLRYGASWLTSQKDLWHIADDLDDCTHIEILGRGEARVLRQVTKVEIRAGNIEEWKK